MRENGYYWVRDKATPEISEPAEFYGGLWIVFASYDWEADDVFTSCHFIGERMVAPD